MYVVPPMYQAKDSYILVKSAAKVTPLVGREPSWELLLLLPLREFFRMIPVKGRMSTLWRLFLRDDGKFPPLESRRWRLESIAAGDTIQGGGTFPNLAYSSSISCFCTACRDCTSHRCFSLSSCSSPHISSSSLSDSSLLR